MQKKLVKLILILFLQMTLFSAENNKSNKSLKIKKAYEFTGEISVTTGAYRDGTLYIKYTARDKENLLMELTLDFFPDNRSVLRSKCLSFFARNYSKQIILIAIYKFAGINEELIVGKTLLPHQKALITSSDT